MKLRRSAIIGWLGALSLATVTVGGSGLQSAPSAPPQGSPQPGNPPPGGTRQGGARATPPRAARPGETAPKGTAVLRGQVVALDTGVPIRKAQVRVVAQAVRDARLATTDAQGRFEVRDLGAGRYTMTASKGGFVTLQYGQRRPGESGTPLEVADSQVLDKLLIGLPRGSVIAGRVTDEFGEPVANASVMAMRDAFVGGARRLVPAGARDTTDDQGQYRLFGLAPGDYIVSANLRTGEVTDPSGDEPAGYAPTYYPGTPNPTEAQRVALALSQENNAVSFGLIATRLVHVSGQVITSSGAVASGGAITLASPGGVRGAGPMAGGGGGRIEGSGAFRVANVAPGRYQLQARSGGRMDGEFARMDITVGGEAVEGLTVVTAPGARVRGSVDTDSGEDTPFGPSQMQVTARPSQVGGAEGLGGGSSARVAGDWTFEIPNIVQPSFIRASLPQGWSLKSVTLNGQDVTDAPVDAAPGQIVTGMEILITRAISSLSGLVSDDRREPVLDATVVVFPVDERLWTFQSRYIKSARPDQEGRYRIADLPAAEYLITAVQALADGGAADPEFLATVRSQAQRLAIKQGEQKTVDVSLRVR